MSYISLSYWLISKPTLSTHHYLLPLRKSSSPFQQSLTMLLSPSIAPYLSLSDFLPLNLSLCLSLYLSISVFFYGNCFPSPSLLISLFLYTYVSISLPLPLLLSLSLSLSPSALERAALAKAKTCCCPAERFVPPVVLYVRVEKKMI